MKKLVLLFVCIILLSGFVNATCIADVDCPFGYSCSNKNCVPDEARGYNAVVSVPEQVPEILGVGDVDIVAFETSDAMDTPSSFAQDVSDRGCYADIDCEFGHSCVDGACTPDEARGYYEGESFDIGDVAVAEVELESDEIEIETGDIEVNIGTTSICEGNSLRCPYVDDICLDGVCTWVEDINLQAEGFTFCNLDSECSFGQFCNDEIIGGIGVCEVSPSRERTNAQINRVVNTFENTYYNAAIAVVDNEADIGFEINKIENLQESYRMNVLLKPEKIDESLIDLSDNIFKLNEKIEAVDSISQEDNIRLSEVNTEIAFDVIITIEESRDIEEIASRLSEDRDFAFTDVVAAEMEKEDELLTEEPLDIGKVEIEEASTLQEQETLARQIELEERTDFTLRKQEELIQEAELPLIEEGVVEAKKQVDLERETDIKKEVLTTPIIGVSISDESVQELKEKLESRRDTSREIKSIERDQEELVFEEVIDSEGRNKVEQSKITFARK